MNNGTKIRTVLRIATSLQNAAVMVTAAVTALCEQYHFTKLMVAWIIFTILCDFFISAITTYYNNDYTEEAALATGRMRQSKAQNKVGYVGENFDEEVETDDEEL